MKTRIVLLAGLLAAAVPTSAHGADPIAVDTTPPVVVGLHLTATRQLTFSVSEYALVHVTVRLREADGRMHTVERLQRAFMPGAGLVPVGRAGGTVLPRGSYSATVTANDVAWNYSPAQVVRFRVG